MDQMHQTHQFEPVYDENSLVLILGTFPSVKSRENRFFYGHPQNRFWKVLAELTGEEVPLTIPDKKQLLPITLQSGMWFTVAISQAPATVPSGMWYPVI